MRNRIYVLFALNILFLSIKALTTTRSAVGSVAIVRNAVQLCHQRLQMSVLIEGDDEAGRGLTAKDNNEEAVIEAWRSRIDRSIAKSRKIRGGNYVQISTVDDQGLPACRTVVFRGFHENKDETSIAMKMITDKRSEKVAQIAANPACEMVWWFAQSKEQYRLSGKLKLIGGDECNPELLLARKQQWGNLSDPAREQFYWCPPGEFSGAPSSVPTGGRDEEGKVLAVPDTFLLMLLYPYQVKYLRLTDNFAQKDSLTGGEWASQRINP